jgi:putative PIN family toxin of toxin-antitoxin system
MRQKYRIIIDTNLWISFLLSKKYNFIENLLDNDKVELVFCEELLEEFVEVATRPKLRKYFASEELSLFFEIIDRYAVHISVVSSITLCRDAKDNFLLSLAKDAKANFLITGDNDLLVLKNFDFTQIVTIAEFQKIIALY